MVRALSFLLLCLALVSLPERARAQDTDMRLFESSCHLAGKEAMTFAQADASNDWHCGEDRLVDHSARQIWLRHTVPNSIEQNVALVGMAAPMDRIEVIGTGRGMLQFQTTVSAQDMVANWAPGNQYAVPLDVDLTRIDRLYIGVSAPQNHLIATELRLVDVPHTQTAKVSHSVLFAMCLGMLLIVALLSGVMYATTRNRDALYHAIFSLIIAVYVASASSLLFLVWPGLGLWGRTIVNYGSMALAFSMLAPIGLRYFEPEVLSPRLRLTMKTYGAFCAAAAFVMPISYYFGFQGRTLYHLLYLPGVVVICYLFVAAARARSQAMKGFLIAWAAPIVFGVERMLRGVNFYAAPLWFDYFFFVALAFQTVVMTIVIALRADRIRRERDHARIHAQLAEEQALRDSLTGLENRRAFDAYKWREGSALVIFDVDRFKSINDTYGHETGDAVLRAVGMALQQAVNEGLARGAWRIGGEEFVIAIDPCDLQRAMNRAEHARSAIGALVAGLVEGLDGPVTASGGLAIVGKSHTEALRAADAALYQAKRSGRNRLVLAGLGVTGDETAERRRVA